MKLISSCLAASRWKPNAHKCNQLNEDWISAFAFPRDVNLLSFRRFSLYIFLSNEFYQEITSQRKKQKKGKHSAKGGRSDESKIFKKNFFHWSMNTSKNFFFKTEGLILLLADPSRLLLCCLLFLFFVGKSFFGGSCGEVTLKWWRKLRAMWCGWCGSEWVAT